MLIRIMLTLVFLFLLIFTSNVVLAEGSKYKFGQGFKLETPAEICPEPLLNIKSQRTTDNFTNSDVDHIKKTFKLNTVQDNINRSRTNEESLSFKKIDEAPAGSSSIFPDKEFRGSHSPDFCGTALGLTFGD